MKLVTVIFLVASFALGNSAVGQGFAQPQQFVAGIQSNAIQGVVSSQRTPMWCWAACIQTVLNYYGINITQEDVAARTFGTDWFGNPPPVGANAEIITRNLNNWSVDRNGVPYAVAAQVFRGAPAPSTIIDQLNRRKPILLGYGPDAQSGHIVVVTAVTYVVDNFGNPFITSITVRDPFPDSWNVQTSGRRVYPNGMLPAPVQWMWFVEVGRT
jgi:hypothetical protein